MNYEVERALRDKADNWKVQHIENEVNRNASNIREINQSITSLQNIISRQEEIIRELINILSNNPNNEDDLNNELNNLSNRL